MNTKDVPGPFFPVIVGMEVGKREEEAPFESPGNKKPFSIFRIFPVKLRKRYQSHFEALGLHLFVRDAERCLDDCANSSNPTYSRSSDKHTHTHYRTEHLPLSSASVFQALVSSAVESALWHLS